MTTTREKAKEAASVFSPAYGPECADAASDVWEKDVELLVYITDRLGSFCYIEGINQHTSLLVFEEVGCDSLIKIQVTKSEAEKVAALLKQSREKIANAKV